MGDIMRPVPFEELLTRVFAEYHESRSIFGIPEQQFYRKDNDRLIKVFGETCETPMGQRLDHTRSLRKISLFLGLPVGVLSS